MRPHCCPSCDRPTDMSCRNQRQRRISSCMPSLYLLPSSPLTCSTSLPRPSARTSGRPNQAARPTQPLATVLCSAMSHLTFPENPSTRTGDHSYVATLQLCTVPETDPTFTGYLSPLAHHPTRGPTPPISRFFTPPSTPTQLASSQQTSTNSRRRF
jgi:hypothetical protein